MSIPDTTAATHLPGQVSPIESNAGIALKSSQFNDYDNLPSNISKKTIKTQDSGHSETISKNTLIEDKQNESPPKKRSAEYDNITLGKESGEKFTIFLGKYNFVESETLPILLDINALSISFFNLALFSAILFQFYGTCCLLIFILVTFHYITVLEILQKPSLSSQCRSHGRDISFSQHFSLNIIVSGPFLGEEEWYKKSNCSYRSRNVITVVMIVRLPTDQKFSGLFDTVWYLMNESIFQYYKASLFWLTWFNCIKQNQIQIIRTI